MVVAVVVVVVVAAAAVVVGGGGGGVGGGGGGGGGGGRGGGRSSLCYCHSSIMSSTITMATTTKSPATSLALRPRLQRQLVALNARPLGCIGGLASHYCHRSRPPQAEYHAFKISQVENSLQE